MCLSLKHKQMPLRDRPIFVAFRRAKIRHYLTIVLFRSPALLVAVFVYSRAATLFGVQIPLADMLAFLPVIFFGAAIPLPMRAVAVTLWAFLFPERTAEMTIFGVVMHNFFIFFNAAIGLVFLPRANRELFGDSPASDPQ